MAELSASQEAATAALAQLDSQLRALSSAIPAVQSINCGTTAGLYCSVRPLYRLAAVVGGGEEGGFAVEVSLHNGGLWELPVGHSLVVLLSGAPPLHIGEGSKVPSGCVTCIIGWVQELVVVGRRQLRGDGSSIAKGASPQPTRLLLLK